MRPSDRAGGDARRRRKYVLTPTPEEFLVVSRVSPEERAEKKGHTGGVLWLTGLSAAGKSTLALGLEHRLHKAGYDVFLLDGDNVRAGLCADLGFSPEDREENIRRIGEVAALFAQAGLIVVTAFISPYRADRARARQTVGAGFHEVFVKASLEECERRDPKGLYARARRGELKDFTGVSAPYEPPEHPELVIETTHSTPEECLARLEAYVEQIFGRPRG